MNYEYMIQCFTIDQQTNKQTNRQSNMEWTGLGTLHESLDSWFVESNMLMSLKSTILHCIES